jgi:hypothetical protein
LGENFFPGQGLECDSLSLTMEPGETLTLTTGNQYYWPSLSHFNVPISAGVLIYAQVDSAHSDTDYGGVMETHEKISGLQQYQRPSDHNDGLIPI